MPSERSSAGDREWLWGAVAAAAVLAIVVWGTVERYTFLAGSPYPFGVDGYWYAIQLDSLLEGGGLYYPSAPLALWWMAPFAYFTDPIVGAKLAAAIGTSLVAVPLYAIGTRLSGSRGGGLVAAALAVTSSQSFYLSTEFVKSGIGLTVAGVFIWQLARALEQPSRTRIAVAALALVATWATHKLAFGLAVVSAIPMLLMLARDRGAALWPPPPRAIAGVLGVLVLLAIGGVLAPERFLGGTDLALLPQLFSSTPQWSLPTLGAHGRELHFSRDVPIAGALGLMVVATTIVAIRRSTMRGWLPPATTRVIVVGSALVAIVCAVPWVDVANPDGLGFRLRLTTFFTGAICAAALVPVALRIVPRSMHAALVVGFVAGLVVSRPATYHAPVVAVHPAMQAAVRAAEGIVPEDHEIICPERHIVFMTRYYTGTKTRLRPERVPSALRWRMIPLALVRPSLRHAIDRSRIEKPPGISPPIGLHPYDPDGLVLMPEATWRWILERLPPKDQQHYRLWPTI